MVSHVMFFSGCAKMAEKKTKQAKEKKNIISKGTDKILILSV